MTPDRRRIEQQDPQKAVASFGALLQIAALTRPRRDDNILTHHASSSPAIALGGLAFLSMVAVTDITHPNVWTRGYPKKTLRSDADAADFAPQQQWG